MLTIQEPDHRVAPARAWSLWNLGFRPFYLLAGAFAAIAMILWVARYAGWTGELAYLRDPLWHAHEMIFGFAQAVIVGFLFTAVGNWTNQPTPTGRHLAMIASTWILARVFVGLSWPIAAVVADTLFTAMAAAGIHKPIHAANNRRNLFFVVLLKLIGLANIGFNLTMAGMLSIPARVMLQTGMNVVLLIMVIMAGRVIPMFTAYAVQARPVRKAWLERVSVGCVIALIAVDVLNLPVPIAEAVAIVAGVANARVSGYGSPGVRSTNRSCGFFTLPMPGLPCICCYALRQRPAWSAPAWQRMP